MTLAEALDWSRRILALSLLIQSAELLRLGPHFRDDAIWSWPVLREGWRPGARRALDPFLRAPSYTGLVVVQLLLAIASFFFDHPALSLTLFLTTLLTSLRFRGLFNGASDSMTLLTLGALTVAQVWGPESYAGKAALGYLLVHLALSYFVAGWAKLRNANWRAGRTFAEILRSPYYAVPGIFQGLARSTLLCALISWSVVLFEVFTPLAWINAEARLVWIALALSFHAGNALLLGLNRFFWAWMATYPILIAYF